MTENKNYKTESYYNSLTESYYNSLTDTEKKILNNFSDIAQQVINEYNLKIDVEMILAIIKNESEKQIAQNLKNNEVVGLTGDYGYMQVTYIAYLDVIRKRSINISFNAMKQNTYENIVIGANYLDMCYLASNNNLPLAFQKYHSGINTKQIGSYGTKAFANYKKFKGEIL